MINKELIIKDLKEKGCESVYEWKAKPNEEDPDHSHTFDVCLFVVEGEIFLKKDGEVKVLRSGEDIFIPREMIHHAKAGAMGCTYIIGEKY